MSNSEFENREFDNTETKSGGKTQAVVIALLSAGLIAALSMDGVLFMRSSQLRTELTNNQQSTQAQMSKIGDATTALLEQRMQAIDQEIKTADDAAATAVKQARSETLRQSKALSHRLDNQQKQVAEELSQLKDESADASSKITAVTTDVSGVKTDVTGVKADVASTKSQLDQTGADLKRVRGDLGVMSGLIATNAKDLATLRELGEHDYTEFDLKKPQTTQKLGDVTITLKKADPKHNRYTVVVLADDHKVEKKDRTINEPVQLYVSGSHQPYEIVVNQIKKNEVVGYLSTPKVKLARR